MLRAQGVLPGAWCVYRSHGGGVEYDTERTGGDRLNASARNLQSPRRALRLCEGLWHRDGTAGCRLIANNGVHSASPSVSDALGGVLWDYKIHVSPQFHEASITAVL